MDSWSSTSRSHPVADHSFRRHVAAAVVVTVAATGLVASAPSAASAAPAATRRCFTHPPRTANDFQAVGDHRNANFGIGDMTSVVRLPDGRLFFTFGDTAYFDLAPDGSAGPFKAFGNNSAWVQSGNCFTLLYGTSPGTRSWLLPPQYDGSVYWPAASVVVGPRLYVFLNRVFLEWPFGRSVGSAVAVFDLPSLSLARISAIPFQPRGVLGIGAVSEDGLIYAYSSRRRSCAFCFAGDLYVARVRESEIYLPGAWRYRSGSSWVADPNAATPVLRDAVSNADVRRYGNGYLLVTKPISIIGPDVHAWWSKNPVGPWQDLGSVFTVPEPPPSYVPGFSYRQAYTYAPTVLTGMRLTSGSFLASYNVNSLDPNDGVRDGRMGGPRFLPVHLPPPPAGAARPTAAPAPSPWAPTLAVDQFGRVHTVNGGVGTNIPRTWNAVAVARTPTGRGGWVAGSDGAVFAFGDARFYGSMGGRHLNQPIVGMAATPSGKGYWLVATDGGIFSFGDAHFYGSTGAIRLNKPILAMAASPTGRGYWFVASDGGIFSFGDTHFYGSTGGAPPSAPVTGMATIPNGRGYWLSTSAGQVFAFGDATFAGNIGPQARARCIGIVAAPGGYRLVDGRGNVFLRGARQGQLRIASASPLVAAG
jgi:hypothetical protein